jgi:hypothetical protein
MVDPVIAEVAKRSQSVSQSGAESPLPVAGQSRSRAQSPMPSVEVNTVQACGANVGSQNPWVRNVMRDTCFGLLVVLLVLSYAGYRFGFHAHFHFVDSFLDPNHEFSGIMSTIIMFINSYIGQMGGQEASDILHKTINLIREFLTHRD